VPDVYLLKLEPESENYKLAPPFSILYLASALEKNDFKVKLYHEIGSPKNIRYILEDIATHLPIFVGLSTMTGPSLIPTKIASQKIKENIKVPVVWGGLHPTMLPEQTLNNDFVDIVVRGEGEEAIVELAFALKEKEVNHRSVETIKSIGYKKNGRINITPARSYIGNLDDYFPAWKHLDITKYFYSGKFFLSDFGSRLPGERIASYISSRGCPWRCSYCYNQFVNKRTFRAHSAKRVINDILHLKKTYGITAVVFEDDNFFTDRKRAIEILKNIELPWSSSLRADHITKWGDDFLKKLKQTQCQELRIGAESSCQRILNIMQKDISVEDIYRSAELCKQNNINALYNFMIGMPGENWDDMLETFQTMDELEKMGKGVVVNGPSVFYPWPGTALYDTAIEHGFKVPEKMEDWAVGWGTKQPLAPYVDRRAKYVGFYRILAKRKDIESLKFPLFSKILRALARKRWDNRFFRFPIDYILPNLIFALLKALGLKKIAQALYN
jgi:anaerobic magnesium-protoporphyrin IX monomethyl ester cyclase